jgi:predicted nucleic acid-binding Zn ribbon protein
MNTTKLCPICQTPLNGRADKKYCSDQCRGIANHKKKLQNQIVLIAINQQLRRNRALLKKLCPEGTNTVRKEILVSMGFNFNLFTSMFLTSSRQVYYLCYDYSYSPTLENLIEKVTISQRQPYMNDWNPWEFVD